VDIYNLSPQGRKPQRRGLALGVKPKARTINPPLTFWAVGLRNTRLLWEDISVLVALASIQMQHYNIWLLSHYLFGWFCIGCCMKRSWILCIKCIKDQQMYFNFFDVLLFYYGHQHISATLVAIFNFTLLKISIYSISNNVLT